MFFRESISPGSKHIENACCTASKCSPNRGCKLDIMFLRWKRFQHHICTTTARSLNPSPHRPLFPVGTLSHSLHTHTLTEPHPSHLTADRSNLSGDSSLIDPIIVPPLPPPHLVEREEDHQVRHHHCKILLQVSINFTQAHYIAMSFHDFFYTLDLVWKMHDFKLCDAEYVKSLFFPSKNLLMAISQSQKERGRHPLHREDPPPLPPHPPPRSLTPTRDLSRLKLEGLAQPLRLLPTGRGAD